jgi:hypothetical protein
MRIRLVYLSIGLFFISCQNSTSNKLKMAGYELHSETRNRYTYNLKGLKDTTLLDYFFFVKGQLGYSRQSISISRYDSSNNLILEQEYEGDNGKLKLVGERHLLYNRKHKLIKDTQIDDGEIMMATILEYNDFDSLSKTFFVLLHHEKTLEEELNRSKESRYDTTITVYHYDNLKHLIDHKMDSSKIGVQNISLSTEERIEITNNTAFKTLDSTWYKNNSKVKRIEFSKGIGSPRKDIYYFNEHGDVVRELNYELVGGL